MNLLEIYAGTLYLYICMIYFITQSVQGVVKGCRGLCVWLVVGPLPHIPTPPQWYTALATGSSAAAGSWVEGAGKGLEFMATAD